jgi:threonine-phosphate decarboxylase
MLHGGDVYTDGILKGIELLDFSSNINPLGVPKSFTDNIAKAMESLTRYPDIKYREVLKSLEKYTGTPEEHFVLGNGAAEIIDLAVSCFKSILIVVPSFVEYELDAKKWGCRIEYSYLNEVMEYDYQDILSKLEHTDAVIIGNPNNPNGGIINKLKFKPILEFCEKEGKTIIIDEAFIEFTGQSSFSFLEEVKEYKGLFIIRALTKFFAMPGIRFGYGIGSNADLLKRIREKQNPWNINCFAEMAAVHVLHDKEYIERSLKWIEEERSYFLEELRNIAFIEKAFNTYSNYVLLKLSGIDGGSLYKYCLEEKIVIRRAHNFKCLDESYIRLAIKDRKSNERLLRVLERIGGFVCQN